MLKDKILNKKIVILGGGFRSLLTAAYYSKYTKNITIISKDEKNFHGIMSPIKVFGSNFDKGYQFFDGFSEENKKFLENLIEEKILHNFGYGASTITNSKIYPYHGIPYWPHKSKKLALKSFLFILKNFFKKNQINKNIKNYQELLDTICPDINLIMQKACLRNTQKKPEELSHLVSTFSHYLNYRQTLMPDPIAKILKKIEYFDQRIASRRKSLNMDQISLYPKGKYIGYVSEIIKKRLLQNGVKFIFSDIIKIEDKNKLQVDCSGDSIETDLIFIVTELDKIEEFFKEKIFKEKSQHYVSQVFFYFKTDKIFSKFQYVHGNDPDIFINRVSNHSLYGEMTPDNKAVLSAECPTPINSELWNNPEKFLKKIWQEIIMSKQANKTQSFTDFKIFNIPKTLAVPLKNYEENIEKLLSFSRNKYKERIIYPGLGKFSRNIFINSLREI